MTDTRELPPLPAPHWPREYFGGVPTGAFTADQVQAYARLAIATLTAERDEAKRGLALVQQHHAETRQLTRRTAGGQLELLP